jgi:hypothetical protein
MVLDILDRPELAFRLVESIWEHPLYIRKDTILLLTRMLNLTNSCDERKTKPSLDWLMEVLKCPSVELKVTCLRAVIEKTNDHFHLCEDRLDWVSQIKPNHLMTLKQTFEDESNPCKVKDLAVIAQENLRFIIKNHRERMHFL